METLERSSQDGTGLTLRIEPIHGPTAKSAVTAASESFDQIRSLKLETVTDMTRRPAKLELPCSDAYEGLTEGKLFPRRGNRVSTSRHGVSEITG